MNNDDELEIKLNSIGIIFPDQHRSVIKTVLNNNHGNVQLAVEQLLAVDVTNADTFDALYDEQYIHDEQNIMLLSAAQHKTSQYTDSTDWTADVNIPSPSLGASVPAVPSASVPAVSVPVVPSASLTQVKQEIKLSMTLTHNGSDYCLPFSAQYTFGGEPERTAFLDSYQEFRTQQGYPCIEVHMVDFVNGVPFDLYMIYTHIVQGGGFMAVNNSDTVSKSNLLWKKLILGALKLDVDSTTLKKVKSLYTSYLLPFEKYYQQSLLFLPKPKCQTMNTNSINDGIWHGMTDGVANKGPRNKHKIVSQTSGTNSAVLVGSSDGVNSSVNSPSTTPTPVLQGATTSSNPVLQGATTSSNTVLQGASTTLLPYNTPPNIVTSTVGVYNYNTPCNNVSYLSYLREDGNEADGLEELPLTILQAREDAEKELEAAQKELSASALHFMLQQVENSDPHFVRITDKCKIFFNLFSNCTIEIKEILQVICPANKVRFYEKAAFLTVPSVIVELYKSCPMINKPLTNVDEIYRILRDEVGGRMYELYKYAKPETEGDCTVVVADVLLGDEIDCSDEHDSADGPSPFWACYSNQIQPKYVVNLRAKKIASLKRVSTYSDVPDILASLNDGVLEVDIRTFDFRNASDPYYDILMKATGLYAGDCVKRQSYHKTFSKAEVTHIGLVVCHKIWRTYQSHSKDVAEQGGKEIYAYHATSPKNVQSIAQNNLDWRRTPVHGRAHGEGCYFSEYPEFSFKYNRECMFIFKLILLPHQYRRHKPNKQGYCEQIIIWDTALFKPVYVLYFNK